MQPLDDRRDPGAVDVGARRAVEQVADADGAKVAVEDAEDVVGVGVGVGGGTAGSRIMIGVVVGE